LNTAAGARTAAGQRRHDAYRWLNHNTIPARRIDTLTDEQLRAIDLA
jgi:hypothetical protein